MKQHERNPILLLSVGIVTLFLTGFLLLVVFGAKSYRDVVDSQYDCMDARGLSAYIAASVKANDRRGAVSVESSDYGPVLVVNDSESGYALRYYRYDGQLVEDFARAGTPLAPEGAQRIAPTEVFSVERRADGLFAVLTAAGQTLLYVRSGEEAAP